MKHSVTEEGKGLFLFISSVIKNAGKEEKKEMGKGSKRKKMILYPGKK